MIKKTRLICILSLFLFLVLLFQVCILHTIANAQTNDTEKTITTSTGRGDITLELFLYDISKLDPNDPIDSQTIVTFKKCEALSLIDPNLTPPSNPDLLPPWGDFPYGLWRSQINLTQEFDPNIHRIIMEISFPGQIDPLNAQYWAQEYDIVQKKVEWEEFDQDNDLFYPNVANRSVTIRLSDSRPKDGDILEGFGDRDPNQRVIDHIGGLLWPIPGGGRCFICSPLFH